MILVLILIALVSTLALAGLASFVYAIVDHIRNGSL